MKSIFLMKHDKIQESNTKVAQDLPFRPKMNNVAGMLNSRERELTHNREYMK